MPSALLQYGFLKDGLALACVYHVIYFRLCWLPACYNVRSSLYYLPAILAAVIFLCNSTSFANRSDSLTHCSEDGLLNHNHVTKGQMVLTRFAAGCHVRGNSSSQALRSAWSNVMRLYVGDWKGSMMVISHNSCILTMLVRVIMIQYTSYCGWSCTGLPHALVDVQAVA